MPKLTRLTSRYMRQELLRVFRDKCLSSVARHIRGQPEDSTHWPSFRITFDVEQLRPGIEAMEALPSARLERRPVGPLREYQKELTI
jgi:hypothetical protein